MGDHTLHSSLKEWGGIAYLHHGDSLSGPVYEDAGVLVDGDGSASAGFTTAVITPGPCASADCSLACTDTKALKMNTTDTTRVNTDSRYEIQSVTVGFCGYALSDTAFTITSGHVTSDVNIEINVWEGATYTTCYSGQIQSSA